MGIQLELQIGREEELWILLQAPFEIKGSDFRILFHSHEEEEERDRGERKVWELRYLQCNWETHKPSDLMSKYHPSLETRARFTSHIFLNPSPPNSLGMQRESQAFKDRFLDFLTGKTHQKFLKIQSSSLQKLKGSKKVLIAYEGMAATTDLIKTNLPKVFWLSNLLSYWAPCQWCLENLFSLSLPSELEALDRERYWCLRDRG